MRNQQTLCDHVRKSPFEEKWDLIYTLCLKSALRWRNYPRHLTAEDLAQIATLKIWEARGQFKVDKSLADDEKKILFVSFFYRVVHNAFIDACRNNGDIRVVSLEETYPVSTLQEVFTYDFADKNDDDSVDSHQADLEEIESNASASALEPLLENLPARQRKVIEMTYGLGQYDWRQNDEKIAVELGITRQTVISDRKKALLDMQTRVGRIGVRAA